jgi:hypothetical protein
MNSFNFSERTKIILRNFSKIKPSLLFKPGQELRTISPNQNMIGVARITETIPARFGIYDIKRLLRILSRYDDPVLIPHDDHLEIKGAHASSGTYPCCSEQNILLPPERDYDIEHLITSFELPNVDLQHVLQVLSISKHPEVLFVRKDNILAIESFDPRNKSGFPNPEPDLYHAELSNDEGLNFQARLDVTYLDTLLPTDYRVSIVKVVNGNEFAIFESEQDIKYYVELKEFVC